MRPSTYPKSSMEKLIAELGVEDPESVFEIRMNPGHVTVYGYVRDDLDLLQTTGREPKVWNVVYPVDFSA